MTKLNIRYLFAGLCVLILHFRPGVSGTRLQTLDSRDPHRTLEDQLQEYPLPIDQARALAVTATILLLLVPYVVIAMRYIEVAPVASGLVVAFKLDTSLSRIDSQNIVDRSSKTLGDPTHGVIVGSTFYHIANSGWNAIDDQGRVKAGVTPTVPRIMRLELGPRCPEGLCSSKRTN